MNGPIESYQLGKPMTWKQFRLMPREIQKEYLDKLRDKFNASTALIGKMLGIDPSTFNLYTKDTILSDPVKHRRLSAEQEAAWNNFINPPKNEAVEPAGDAVEPEENQHVCQLTYYTDEQEAAAIAEELAEEQETPAEVTDTATTYFKQVSYPKMEVISGSLRGTPESLLLGLNALLQSLPYDAKYCLRLVAEEIGDADNA